VIIAAILIPLHHQLTHWLKAKLSGHVKEHIEPVEDMP